MGIAELHPSYALSPQFRNLFLKTQAWRGVIVGLIESSTMHVPISIFDVTQTHGTCGALRCKGGSAGNVKTGAAMSYITKTPKPPYYAVVFTSINADVDHTEHTKMYQRMVEIAEGYEGYIGIEPARNPDGSGVAVIYWKDLATIQAFARHPEHVVAKKKGREIWYTHYLIRICKVERDYGRPEESESISSPAESPMG